MFFLPAIIMAGCVSSSIVWTGHHSFSGVKWTPEELVIFTPDTVSLQDSIVRPHRGVLSIRYTAGSNVEKLPVVMEIESPGEGIYRVDTLWQSFLPVSERSAHKGKMGIFETLDTIELNSTVVPGWTVSFYPAVEDDVEGVISLTLDIIKNEK